MRWWTALLFGVGLLPAQSPTSGQAFAGMFSAVLAGENPDGGTWGDAAKYLAAATGQELHPQSAIRRVVSAPINKYRVLIVPGFMSTCTFSASASAPAFKQARDHLKATHGVDIELLQVPDDSSENNGLLIAKYLRDHSAGARYIVVGHSKGVVDLQLALQDPVAASSVAAFISVAGAVGGSPLADLAEGRGLLGSMEMSIGCAGKIGPALKSLRTDERKAFLASHPHAPVPSYSLVAESGFTTTSKILLAPWGLLGAGFRGTEDGMLLAADGTLPGSKFLGAALADHVAMAHDFGQSKMSKLYDKGNFPRVALLEALLRYVIADLSSGPPGLTN